MNESALVRSRSGPSHDITAPRQLGHHVRVPSRWVGRWWVALIGIACAVASDYKFRVRDVNNALSGQVDLNILLELVVYGAVAVFLITRTGVLRMRPPVDRLLVGALVFAGVTVVSGLYATYPTLGLVRGAQTLVVGALAVSVCTLADRAHLVRFVQLFAITTACSVAFGAVVRFPRLPLQADRFNWLHVHPVIVGTYLGIAVVVSLALLTDHRLSDLGLRLPKWFLGMLLAVNALGLVATKTRGGAGGAIVGVIVFLLVRAGRRRVLELGMAILLVVGAVALAFGDQIVRFAERDQTGETIATLNSRTRLWDLAFDAFQRRPLQGYGLGASRGIFFDETGLGGGHNAFVEVLVASGAIGIVAFAVLLTTLILRAARLSGRSGRVDRPLLLGFMAFSLVNGITTEGLGAPANVSAIWLFLAASWVVVSARADRRPALKHVDRSPVHTPRRALTVGTTQ